MSKRAAEVQGDKNGWFKAIPGSDANGGAVPARATASQMARRKLATPRGHPKRALQQQTAGSQSSSQTSSSNQAPGTAPNTNGNNIFQSQGFTASTSFDFGGPNSMPNPFATPTSTDKGKGKATEPPVDPKWQSVKLDYGTAYRVNSDDPDKKLYSNRDPAGEVAPQWAASSPYHHSKTPAIDALTGSTAAQDIISLATITGQNASQPQRASPGSSIPGLFANTGLQAATSTSTAQQPTQSAPGRYTIQELPQKKPGTFGLTKPVQSTSNLNSSVKTTNPQPQTSTPFGQAMNTGQQTQSTPNPFSSLTSQPQTQGQSPASSTASDNGQQSQPKSNIFNQATIKQAETTSRPFGQAMAQQTQSALGSNSSGTNSNDQPQALRPWQQAMAQYPPPTSGSSSSGNNTNIQPQASSPFGQQTQSSSNPFANLTSQPQTQQSSSNPFSNVTSQPQAQTQSSQNPFASNSGQQSQPILNIFSQPTNQQQAQSTFHPFGNDTNHSQGQSQSPTSSFSQTLSSSWQPLPTSSIFSQSTNQQQQSQPSQSMFDRASPRLDQSQADSDMDDEATQSRPAQQNSNVFGQSSNQQSLPSSNVFAQTISQQQPSVQASSSVFSQLSNQKPLPSFQPNSNLFSKTSSQQPSSVQATSNNFSHLANQKSLPSFQSSSNMFSQNTNQQQSFQSSSNVFNQNANQQQQSQPSRSIFDLVDQQRASQPPSMIFTQPTDQQQLPHSAVGSFNQPSTPQQSQLAFSAFGQNTNQAKVDHTQSSYRTAKTPLAQAQQANGATDLADVAMVSPPDPPLRQNQTPQNQAQTPSIFQTLSRPQTTVTNLGQSLFSKQNKPDAMLSNVTSNKTKQQNETASRPKGILTTPKPIDGVGLPKPSIKPALSSSSISTATTKVVETSQAGQSTGQVASGSSTTTPRKAVQFTPKVSTAKPASKSSDTIGLLANNKSTTVPPGKAKQTIPDDSAAPAIPSDQDQLTTLMPPALPNHLSEGQMRSFVVGYRLRSLDVGLKKHVMQTDSFSADSLVMRFHAKTKEAILKAGASVLSVAGVKRRSIDDRADEPKPQAKRVNVNGPVSDGLGAKRPIFNLPSNKRKADEIVAKEFPNGTVDSGKKARGNEEVSYPALHSSEESKTSKIFANIANDIPSKPTPKLFTQSSNISTSSPPKFGGGYVTYSSNATAPSGGTKSNEPISFFVTPPENAVLTLSTATASLSEKANVLTPTINPNTSSSTSSDATKSVASHSGISQPPVFMSSSTFSGLLSKSTNPPAFQLPKFGAISGSAGSGGSSSSTKPPEIKVPKFGAVDGTSFMAQFGKKVEENAQKEKEKRKAEEFDSDEDDEAEWERQDAEKQRAKKQKLEEAAESAKNNTFKFNHIKASSSGQKPDSQSPNSLKASPNPATSTTPEGSPTKPLTSSAPFPSKSSTPFGESVISNMKSSDSQSNVREDNIFGKYSNPTSDAEGSKTGNADDEESDVSDYDDDGGPQDGGAGLKPRSPVVANRSLFDRIKADEHGNPKRDTQPSEEKRSEEKKPENPFAKSAGAGIFAKSSEGQKTGSLSAKSTSTGGSSLFGQQPPSGSGFKGFGTSTASFGDKTWKPESPIRFRDADVVTSLSDPAATPTRGTFTELKGSPASEFTSLFGASKPSMSDTSGKSFSNIFGDNTPVKAPSSTVGFGFGGPPKPFTAGSLAVPTPFGSNATSRATSPGATTGGESANESTAEGADNVVEQHEQVDLTSGPEEQDEINLFELEATAFEFNAEKKWAIKGVGRLKVMKHGQSAKTRILMRMNPGGKIILNAALMSNMKYEHVPGRNKASVRFGAATGAGNLTTWLIQPTAMEHAEELAKVLKENKSN